MTASIFAAIAFFEVKVYGKNELTFLQIIIQILDKWRIWIIWPI